MPVILDGALGVLAVRAGAPLASALLRRWRLRAAERLASSPAPGGPLLLGTDLAGRAVTLVDSQLAAHGLILGASGAGKSTTLLGILCTQIARGRPVVALDLKGSPAFAAQLRGACEHSGRALWVWTPDGPARWNPLAHGNPTELKDKLIATERFTEPHYQRSAERYVQTAFQVMALAHPERPATLAGVVELLDPTRLAAESRTLLPQDAERVRDYVTSLTPDALSAVRGLAARLAVISESHTGRFLGSSAPGLPGIDLRRALAGEYVVLFSLNSSRYGTLSAQLGTLVVQDLVAAAGDRLGIVPPAPATVAIDEFSALGSDNVISLLARGREAGLSVLLATQELADLDRAARGLRDQVLGNTAVKIAHRQDVPGSAETVAQMAGKVREWEPTYALGAWGRADRRRGTLRQVQRYVVEPDRVRSLRTGEAVVIVKTPRSRTHVMRMRPPRYPPAPGVTR